MAEVRLPVQVECDNCGKRADKIEFTNRWVNPDEWGSLEMFRRNTPGRIDVNDLCPECYEAAFHAAREALVARQTKGEEATS